MDQKQLEYLDSYQQNLTQHLLKMLTTMQYLDGQLLETPDISDKWHDVAPSYVADAVKEIAQYPNVALGWAMYLGMAVARYWDEDWSIYGNVPNLYEYIRDKRGFDYMDEVVRGEILMLKDKDFDEAEKLVQACSQQVLNKIRYEQIEPQSPLAFHAYARSIETLYKMGAAVELKALGYKFEKIN